MISRRKYPYQISSFLPNHHGRYRFYVNNAEKERRSRMDPPWITKARGKGSYTQGRGRSSPSSSRSSYLDLHHLHKKELHHQYIRRYSEKVIHYMLNYWEFITSKRGDSFASIAKEEVDDIKTYEKRRTLEDIPRYLVNGLYFPWVSHTKLLKYYETLANKHGVEFQHFSDIIQVRILIDFLNDRKTIRPKQSHGKLLPIGIIFGHLIKFSRYNNERHKHTWFIKAAAKIFKNPIPNWFLNWWSYHGPTIKILPEPFHKLYKEWVKVSPDLNKLYHQEHICYFQQIEQIYFFIEFSVP
ncbi:hypothetical protein H5410_065093 [Solanum commersonii]|uniref:Uncharacterized protein n=1 Tax=Solanum commersonii TaxID=4109 RepID=A0A9J5VXH1_SOLCO|nr:hypothetical protein H5410_065093 [Solanum commersonii]